MRCCEAVVRAAVLDPIASRRQRGGVEALERTALSLLAAVCHTRRGGLPIAAADVQRSLAGPLHILSDTLSDASRSAPQQPRPFTAAGNAQRRMACLRSLLAPCFGRAHASAPLELSSLLRTYDGLLALRCDELVAVSFEEGAAVLSPDSSSPAGESGAGGAKGGIRASPTTGASVSMPAKGKVLRLPVQLLTRALNVEDTIASEMLERETRKASVLASAAARAIEQRSKAAKLIARALEGTCFQKGRRWLKEYASTVTGSLAVCEELGRLLSARAEGRLDARAANDLKAILKSAQAFAAGRGRMVCGGVVASDFVAAISQLNSELDAACGRGPPAAPQSKATSGIPTPGWKILLARATMPTRHGVVPAAASHLVDTAALGTASFGRDVAEGAGVPAGVDTAAIISCPDVSVAVDTNPTEEGVHEGVQEEVQEGVQEMASALHDVASPQPVITSGVEAAEAAAEARMEEMQEELEVWFDALDDAMDDDEEEVNDDIEDEDVEAVGYGGAEVCATPSTPLCVSLHRRAPPDSVRIFFTILSHRVELRHTPPMVFFTSFFSSVLSGGIPRLWCSSPHHRRHWPWRREKRSRAR